MFAEIYNEILEVAQREINKGVPLQIVYGAIGAAHQRIDFMLNSHYEEKRWDSVIKGQLDSKPEPPPAEIPLAPTE